MDATLLRAPVIAGEVVLAYAATDAGTQTLNAWDLSDGTLLWERITLPGRNLRGQQRVHEYSVTDQAFRAPKMTDAGFC
ncbi:hypothetical protein JF531_00545 [Microbacterium esteraromaticum]|uniref:hypothetical protein n=1 Tax=Microbacterium esteraromaticum TaxID=57043 RepID=UPI001A8D9561|nr:hypothetical protein [Microbacterium esteraromaticum]MBN8423009.1 hypothetical protein [Microbacterium esteraromaticum]